MEVKLGDASAAPVPAAPAPEAAAEKASSSGVLVSPPAAAAGVAAGAIVAVAKPGKKRGRPRKYGPDGNLIRPLSAAPMAAPGPYTPAAAVGAAMKRGRGRPMDFAAGRQQFGFHFDSLGGMVACSAGANFTPHIITVAPGEDVTMKVISFSQQGPRAICILSANGVISNVTLRQPDSFGGTLTYEGRFELLSLSGSFMPSENGGTKSRSGGMSVSLAGPDGRVVGGGVAGLLVAAGPIQIVVGSFLPSYQMEQKAKRPKVDTASIPTHTPPAPTVPISSAETHSSDQGQHSSATPRINVVPSTYSADQNWASPVQSIPDPSRNPSSDVKITVSGA